jgi:N-acyl-D-aspartate/D-glutamate deacylase
MPPMMDLVISQFDRLSKKMFPCFEIDEGMDYEPEPSKSIGAMAAAKGIPPMEVMYNFLCEGDGANSIYYPIFNYAPGDLSKVRNMLQHPKALSSLADGGAHVGTICDASCTTTMLAHWALQRTRGPRIPLPHVVEMLTGRNAKFIGLADRGVIEPGMKTDLNLVQLDRLALPLPRIVRDLPSGGRRLMQKASGYLATFVSGQAVTEDGEITATHPGRWTWGQAPPLPSEVVFASRSAVGAIKTFFHEEHRRDIDTKSCYGQPKAESHPLEFDHNDGVRTGVNRDAHCIRE